MPKYDYDKLAPPKPAPANIRLGDLIGRVVAGFGPEDAGVMETAHGTARPCRLERLVAFDRKGEIEYDLADFLVFPPSIAAQFLAQEAVLGKLVREGEGPYQLTEISPKKMATAIAALRKWDDDARDRKGSEETSSDFTLDDDEDEGDDDDF